MNLGVPFVFQDVNSDPASPASGFHSLYSKSGGLYVKNPAGTVTLLGSGGGSSAASYNPESASYELVLSDANNFVGIDNASANNLTVPLNATVSFPIGTQVGIMSLGVGQTTIVPTGGVTIRNNAANLKLRTQYSQVLLTKIGTDEWIIVGDLETIDGSDFCINVQALTYSPVDNQTVYFGVLPKAPTTTANISKVYVRRTCKIIGAEIYCYSGTAGSNESWSLHIRKNNTADYLIASVAASTNERVFSNTGGGYIDMVSGDYFEMKSVQPAWGTNPLTTIWGGYLILRG
jgi:hypothetical protein